MERPVPSLGVLEGSVAGSKIVTRMAIDKTVMLLPTKLRCRRFLQVPQRMLEIQI